MFSPPPLQTFYIKYKINAVVAAIRFLPSEDVFMTSQRDERTAWAQFTAQMQNECLRYSVEEATISRELPDYWRTRLAAR